MTHLRPCSPCNWQLVAVMCGHTHYFGSSHISKIHWWHWAPPLCIYTDKLLGGGFFHVWKFEQNTGEKIMLLLVSWRKHLPNNPRQIMSILPMLSQHWPTLRPLSKEWCVQVCSLTSFLLLRVEQWSGVKVTISFEKQMSLRDHKGRPSTLHATECSDHLGEFHLLITFILIVTF